ncbi:hypothetical protein QR680_015507 [Steinernema hermaphroditum]|uniref:N-acetyltransferase domain-containing protein n=1 Tax=Steinernema hermaphroditum TaxID=289476 RepID=A0AA39LKZ0_9BILA|nr:hypothetical protein QR680_015507 [Steinernema hermaphroditum]
MFRKNGILFRKIEPEDVEALVKFMMENLPKTSSICRALQFEQEDYEAMYIPRIAESIPSNISVLAIDESIGEIVGYHLDNYYYRDPAKNPPNKPKKTAKAQILASLSESLRNEFWKVCPPEVQCVVRGESSCTRKDYQRRGIGETFIQMMLDDSSSDKKVSGGMAASTSLPNQVLCRKIGFLDMAEVSYKELFEANGIPFEGAFKDGTTKCVLQFRPNSDELQKKTLLRLKEREVAKSKL